MVIISVSAQDEGFAFGLDMELGAESFDEAVGSVSYQILGLKPDFSIGKFGIGIDATIHWRFDDTGNLTIRKADWVPEGDVDFFELYLPKFRYVRYSHKGEDLFVKLGSIDDATLGNGFIMGNYDNTLSRPKIVKFGMSFDLDGRLFDFPYVGIESFVGRFHPFEIFGGRIFARPLYGLDLPIIKELQVGITAAGDVDPDEDAATAETLLIYGIDVMQPILSGDVFSLAAFGDFVLEPDSTMGGMIGFGGRIIGLITYGAQARFLAPGFIPVYFDATYDLYRTTKITMIGDKTIPSFVGWFGSLGFSLLDDLLVFTASLDGPFSKPDPGNPDNFMNYPHLRVVFLVNEGLIPGMFFEAYYDKKMITEFKDIIDPEDAVIGAAINYKTGPAVITLAYDMKWLPKAAKYETTAKLSTSISLF